MRKNDLNYLLKYANNFVSNLRLSDNEYKIKIDDEKFSLHFGYYEDECDSLMSTFVDYTYTYSVVKKDGKEFILVECYDYGVKFYSQLFDNIESAKNYCF